MDSELNNCEDNTEYTKSPVTMNDTKESEGEGIEAIKKFIEEQEKEIESLEAEVKPNLIRNVEATVFVDNANDTSDDESLDDITVTECVLGINQIERDILKEENMSVASSVIDMILKKSEAQMSNINDLHKQKKKFSEGIDKVLTNSVALSVGSQVEAKDFSELWHPAQIVEVDYDELEVLLRYKDITKKHDEWISVSSPRLRPLSLKSLHDNQAPRQEDIKSEGMSEKPKMVFKVGDRCLARWRDNRRFMATVNADLGNDQFEVIFDDGFHWKCSLSRLSKTKESDIVQQAAPAASTSDASPSAQGPSGPLDTLNHQPLPYHTHLFDPSRDYLGSKSERRERKRKLNIKEIFNIGQKKKKEHNSETPVKKKRKVIKERKVEAKDVKKNKHQVQAEVSNAVPDVTTTIKSESKSRTATPEIIPEIKQETDPDINEDIEIHEIKVEDGNVDLNDDDNDAQEAKERGIIIDKIKDTINKLEDDLRNSASPKPIVVKQELQPQPVIETPKVVENEKITKGEKERKRNLSRIRKAKKLRLLQEKKVKKEVEQVKNELEAMKTQLEEMKKQVVLNNAFKSGPAELGHSFLLPGEWCCKWLNGQPVGTVSEIQLDSKDGKAGLLRRSVQVEDRRLPPNWTKHMIRRSLGSSAGKWDVVLVSPDNKRLHTKNEMRNYIEQSKDESLKQYESPLLDFGVHKKLSRRIGWDAVVDSGEAPLPSSTLSTTSPILKQKKLSLKKLSLKKEKKRSKKLKMAAGGNTEKSPRADVSLGISALTETELVEPQIELLPLEDGYVYVGSLKVQIIENLLRCPADGCFKNFRNNTLLQMHIKHYHRELRKMLGATPKVSDLAHARTAPDELDPTKIKTEELKVPKIKTNKKRTDGIMEPKDEISEPSTPLHVDVTPTTPVKSESDKPPVKMDSPRLRTALTNKPVKRPKVLLPVRRIEDVEPKPQVEENQMSFDDNSDLAEPLDFESAISTHFVSKPILEKKKKKKMFANICKFKPASDEEDWVGGGQSDFETRFSFPRSITPESRFMDKSMDTPTMMTSESADDFKEQNNYTFTENGERIKIVHMKREEIINCHCGFREEDGLMIQCELCLCWQHALCHNIQKEAEVPEKYTCSICLNPRRGRRSQRFLHDQDRLYEGLLAGARPGDCLKRAHELSGNLLRVEDALHALRVNTYVAGKTKPDHPKLYLWATDWGENEVNTSRDKISNEYTALNSMIGDIGKENLPIKTEDMHVIGTPPSELDSDRYSNRDNTPLGSQQLFSGLLSSPGGASLDLPITTSELERLAKSVQESESRVNVTSAPQPEAPIESADCRVRLLKHIQRCQALIDARLDSIEAQVAELESQDPSFEDDETADFFPRTKQTVQMLMRDLDTMEELGIIT